MAARHIHMTPADTAQFDVKDGELVSVIADTPRPVVFRDVVVRVRDDFALDSHIDIDEGNAAFQHRRHGHRRPPGRLRKRKVTPRHCYIFPSSSTAHD